VTSRKQEPLVDVDGPPHTRLRTEGLTAGAIDHRVTLRVTLIGLSPGSNAEEPIVMSKPG